MLYEQIASNKRKSVLFVIGFILFVLIIGACLTYLWFGDLVAGFIIASILLIIYVPITISRSIHIVMTMNHAKEIKSKRDFPHLWYSVENMTMVARVPMPKIYVIHDPSPNAFATGLKPENAAVAVTTGLVEKLNREELEAVIAHEVAHIKNYDVMLSTISVALVSIVALLSDFGSRIIFHRKSNNKQHPLILLIAFILIILAPIIAVIIQLALSRNREFLADATGAKLCRNPQALASALRKITDDNDPIEEISQASAAMYFADPFKKKVSNLFSTHPPAEERIRRLMRM